MTTHDIKHLWQLYIKNEATPEQVQQLYDLIREKDRDDENQEIIEEFLARLPVSSAGDNMSKEFIIGNLSNKYPELAGYLPYSTDVQQPKIPTYRVHFLRRWGWVAASLLLVLGTGTYLWTTQKNNNATPVIAQQTVDIAPGKEGAILTLADGSQVSLDSVQNATVALQGGVTARVIDGALQYEGSGHEVVYNTMSTPRGRQFQVTLPDGTKVWLNSASSIRYPTLFQGKERSVTMTGEAYFEVTKSSAPFVVNADGRADIKVLGTHFNVNSYANETVLKTTLLEGAVQVSNGNERVRLSPGEQAQVTAGIHISNDTDIEKVMAWKNGLFNFDGMGVAELMRQVERWYDVEVVYENGIPPIEFVGELSRNTTLVSLLNGLRYAGVHYRLEGRKLIIAP